VVATRRNNYRTVLLLRPLPLAKPMKMLLASLLCLAFLTPRLAADEPVDYLRDIKPILAKYCYGCHGAETQKSRLRLDTAALALKGGKSGPIILPGKSKESKLLKAVTGGEGVTLMPPREPRLNAKQIALLKAWIDQGAKPPPAGAEPAVVKSNGKHWAFQTPVRPALPAVKNHAWVRNPIDRFILARLEKEGIKPSPQADRVTLIRRLSLDLLGLPPTPDEIDAFLADVRPGAYEHLVDRLLASPHYGERWARHWLDLARYADSNGFNIDAPRSIWKYRDWVIDAFNRDLPFDQFTIEQMAGDLLPKAALAQKVATGFHRNTLLNQEGGIDLEQFRVESVVDRVNTTGAVFLGLTVGCAQCHDHKYDPISQKEYFQLFAFLNNADEPNLALPTPAEVQQLKKIRDQIVGLQAAVRNIDTTSQAGQRDWEKDISPQDRLKLPLVVKNALDVPDYQRDAREKQIVTGFYRKTDWARHLLGGFGTPFDSGVLPAVMLTAAHLHTGMFRAGLDQKVAALKKQEPKVVTTMVLQERATSRETHVHIKGDFLRKGARVFPAVPAVLHPLAASKTPNRLDLAQWLVDPKNPLTARVTVNRFWQHYFGVGLVETENDFGLQGTPPTHPELLDWLATEFIARKWSVKGMHRLLVTSATYRQSSHSRPDLATIDPKNRLLARQARLRLEAEVVRDIALSASGLLSRKMGGPSVFPPQPEGVFAFTQVPRDWKASKGSDRYRRGMYTYFWRSAPHPALTVFDAPESTATCTRRNRSNTPLQALTLLNDQAFLEFAQGLALRALKEDLPNDTQRLRFAFRLCLARSPSALEVKRLEQLLQEQLADFASSPKEARLLAPPNLSKEIAVHRFAAWTTVARVLLNLDEFITRE
jgi:hypothetical protein